MLDARLQNFLDRCDAECNRLGVKRSTLSTRLFKDGKRLNQIASGNSDIGIGRLALAEADLAAMEKGVAQDTAA